MGKKVLAFDLYGTLLSTASIATVLAEYHGPEMAESIQAAWRRCQLEYTWRLNSMKHYEDFEKVTRESLIHTLAEHRVEMKPQDIDAVMDAYDNLGTFNDVLPGLEALSKVADVECVVFSNGTRKMIGNSVNGSKSLKSVSSIFSRLVSVDHLRSFKPAPEVYKYLANCVGMAGTESELWLVSSNAFDVVGARAAGLKAVWVDRADRGWQDRLGYKPTAVISRLEELQDLIKEG